VAELTNTERRANGSYRELQRIKQLETELERLIVAVDQRLKTAPANAGEETADAPPTMLAWLRQGLTPKRGLAVLAGGSALLLLGWFGASRYYETRLAYAVQAELRPFTMELDAVIANIDADMALRLQAAEEARTEVARAYEDVVARQDSFDAAVADAEQRLAAAGQSAAAAIEQRLGAETGELATKLDGFEQRAAEVDQGFTAVGQRLTVLREQLPTLADGVSALDAALLQSRTAFDQASAEIDALKEGLPALVTTLAEQRAASAEKDKTLQSLEQQIAALKGRAMSSTETLEEVAGEGEAKAARWQAMDQEITSRQEQVIRNLDLYAESLKTRVREFLDVLNGETLASDG
jgi:hypothetical protein